MDDAELLKHWRLVAKAQAQLLKLKDDHIEVLERTIEFLEANTGGNSDE